ncbi:uncharacterized protein BXZ73DRAFT_73667 [Epithele typhae]|uniref:uncharacterized protein n=1 Tax=Epithele typhae TaxID=378194 RepID=UPI002008B984|nr:uncharacterized protein BXZ73DRAFT_73667 [Epithele typhae]KAH9944031.1 hypothetical protein BXZ73DRAFT_73667 [Epithele typhae]
MARVELGRRDQWKTLGEGHARELAVMSGTIRGAVIRHGLRGMIGQYPLISAVFASGIFFFILFIGLVVCLMPIVEWHFPSESEEARPMEPEDKQRKRKRSRRPEGETRSKIPATGRREGSSSSRSRQRDQEVKAEAEEAWEYAPVASIGTAPGTTAIRETSARRRTSRQSDEYEQ